MRSVFIYYSDVNTQHINTNYKSVLNKNYSFIVILKPSSLTPSGYNWKELSQTSIDRIWIVVGAKRRQFSKLVITNFNTLMISYSSFVWRMILDARYCTVVATKTSSYIFTKVTCHSSFNRCLLHLLHPLHLLHLLHLLIFLICF